MSDEEKNAGDAGAGTAAASVPGEQPYVDEHTTEPNAPQQAAQAAASKTAPQKWQMPKPKFQQSSGYLPQGYLKDIKMTADGTSEDVTEENEQLTAERITGIDQAAAPPPAAPSIEPQPDLVDQLIPEDPPAVNQMAAPQKGSSRLPFLLLGLVGIFLFIAVFLAAVYYFFLAKPVG